MILQKVASEEPLVQNEVKELRALLKQDRKQTMAQHHQSQIGSRKSYMHVGARLGGGSSSMFPHLPHRFPTQQIRQQHFPQQPFIFPKQV